MSACNCCAQPPCGVWIGAETGFPNYNAKMVGGYTTDIYKVWTATRKTCPWNPSIPQVTKTCEVRFSSGVCVPAGCCDYTSALYVQALDVRQYSPYTSHPPCSPSSIYELPPCDPPIGPSSTQKEELLEPVELFIEHYPSGTGYIWAEYGWFQVDYTTDPATYSYEKIDEYESRATPSGYPVNREENLIRYSIGESPKQSVIGEGYVGVARYSCVEGYAPDISDPDNPQPNGFPDPAWEPAAP